MFANALGNTKGLRSPFFKNPKVVKKPQKPSGSCPHLALKEAVAGRRLGVSHPIVRRGMCYRRGLGILINPKWNDLCPGETPRGPRPALQLSLCPRVALLVILLALNSFMAVPKPVDLKIPTSPFQGLFPQPRALLVSSVGSVG